MKRLLSFGIILASMALTACSGDGNTILTPDPGGPDTTPVAASIQLIASSPQLQSDQFGLTTVTISAIAKDANNNVIQGIPIIFSADNNGALILDPTQPFTGVNGLISAELSNGVGDASNRTISVSATDGTVTATIAIDVVGTTLTINGPNALAQGGSAPYTIILADSNGVGITGESVAVTSANGNTISPASTNLTTGVDGDVQISLTADQPGNDTLTATGFSETATQTVSVSGDSFVVTSPAPGAELDLLPAPLHDVSAEWTISGVPQVGQQINFTSTRGTLSAGSAVTNASGIATVQISSANAGPAQITAEIDTSGTAAGVAVEFVATTPDSLTIQASPFTVAVNEQSEISAIVRDAAFNLVKNQTVNFLIVADDSNGFLSVASTVTDSQGRAVTFYTGGGVSGSPNGVTISATVAGTAISGSVNLTVARKELDLVIGTGNEIFEPTTASFAQEWNILVTDSVGNAVANSTVQVSLRSIAYYEGFLIVNPTPPPNQWIFGSPSPTFCADEDANRNGSLDLVGGVIGTGEDLNGSGQLEAGNVALVSAVPPTASATTPCASAGAGGTSADVVTNSQGLARVCVIWPQNFSWWVDVQIEARASVSGTEFSAQQLWNLPALADDINDVTSAPPNVISPFGPDNNCATPPPGLPL